MKKVDPKQFEPLFLGHYEEDGYYLDLAEWWYAYEKGLLNDRPQTEPPPLYKWFQYFRDNGFYVKWDQEYLRIWDRGYRPDKRGSKYILVEVSSLKDAEKALNKALEMRKGCLIAWEDKIVKINYFGVESIHDEG